MNDTGTTKQHEHHMRQALELALLAAKRGEVPIGAVLVREQEVIGSGHNSPITKHDPTAHAEIQALRQAARNAANYRLPNTTLYVTVEPCTMCVGALIHARVNLLVFGTREPRAGAVVSQHQLPDHPSFNHHLEFTEGILEAECAKLMQEFFQSRRANDQCKQS